MGIQVGVRHQTFEPEPNPSQRRQTTWALARAVRSGLSEMRRGLGRSDHFNGQLFAGSEISGEEAGKGGLVGGGPAPLRCQLPAGT